MLTWPSCKRIKLYNLILASMQPPIYTCMIIDDDPGCHQDREFHLSPMPDLTLLANCYPPVDGIEKSRSLKPDIVFLDYNMPYMTGLQMLAALHEADIKVGLITADNRYTMDLSDPQIKASAFKPLSPRNFITLVRKILIS